MQLDKHDLNAIANRRANRSKIVQLLVYLFLGYACLLISGVFLYSSMSGLCISFMPWGALAFLSITALAIACIVVQEIKRRKILKQLEEEYLAENTRK